MRKIISMLGSSIVGGVGWWIGYKVGIMTAVVLSGIGSGVGVWLAYRFASEYLP